VPYVRWPFPFDLQAISNVHITPLPSSVHYCATTAKTKTIDRAAHSGALVHGWRLLGNWSGSLRRTHT
jgi:hypothetical protein